MARKTSRNPTILCRFDSADHLTGKQRTYEAVKAAVLEAGKYSIFEATANAKNIRLFEALKRDPEVEHYDLPYPWIGVRRRNAKTREAGSPDRQR